ncbi:MAG: NUDIX domain-containing protein [Butyricicoccus sp.]
MDMTEKQLSSEYKFKGRIMTARVDEVSLPNGKTAPREVCEHVGGVGVLPIDKDGNVILVRQFRYAFDTELLEMPAGKMDHGPEDAEECGIRELERSGCTADASCRSARFIRLQLSDRVRPICLPRLT